MRIFSTLHDADATPLILDVAELPAVCREISGDSIDLGQTPDGLVSTQPNFRAGLKRNIFG